MDERNSLHPIMDGHTQLNYLVIHGVEEGMAGAVGGVAGPPLSGPPKVSGSDETFLLRGLHFLVLFAALKIRGPAGHNPVPRKPPVGHLPHSLRRSFHKQPDHLLVCPPIGSFHRIFKMNIRTVTSAHGRVPQSSLHTPLGRR